MNLDFSKASERILKNHEPELSYILAKCLKELCFPNCSNVLSAVLVFQNVGERATAKNYHHVSLLAVVNEVLEKLVIELFIT